MSDVSATYIDLSRLSQIMTKILGTECDVIIVCSDGVELTINQALLDLASDVFEAMFRNNLLEKKNRKVTIDDVSSKTMQSIVGYLKSGELDVDDIAHDEMLYAVEKYNMKMIKKAIADQLIEVDVNHIGDAYELLVQYGSSKDCEKLASRAAFSLRSVPQDQLEKLDAKGFLRIAEALKNLLELTKTANNEKKEFWQYFFKMYDSWLRTDLAAKSQTAEKILSLIDFHLFDQPTVAELLLTSPVLDVISPFLSAIIRRLSGMGTYMKARSDYSKHITLCPNASIQCTQCRFAATPEKFHASFNCAYASRCTACNVQLTLPQPYNQASVLQLAGTEPILPSNSV